MRFYQKKVLVVGIDIGRDRHTACGLDSSGRRYGRLDFTNDACGFEGLLKGVEEWKERSGMEEVIFGLEPSGHYWRNLASWLKSRGYRVVQVRPYATKRMKDIEDNSPLKTDSKDAYIIADLVMQGKYFEVVIPEGVYAELAELSVFRKRLVDEITEIKNIITSIVDLLFPEIFSVFKSLWSKSALYILKNYLPVERLKKVPLDVLLFELGRVSKGRVGVNRVKRLKSLAEVSIGMSDGAMRKNEEMVFYIKRLEELVEEKRRIERRMREILETLDEAVEPLKLRGIGVVTLSAFLGFTNGLKDFRSSNEVLKFMGLNLIYEQSGKWKGRKRISKRGNAILREIMFFAGLRQAMKGAPLGYYYRRLKERGKPASVIVVAVTRKIVKILFWMVKNRVPFNPAMHEEAA